MPPDSAGHSVPLGEAGGAVCRLLFATRFVLSAPVGLAALVALLAAAALAVDLVVDCSAASGALVMGSGSQGYKDGERRHASRCIRPTSSSPPPHPSYAMEQRQHLIRPLEVDGDGAEVERDYYYSLRRSLVLPVPSAAVEHEPACGTHALQSHRSRLHCAAISHTLHPAVTRP